MDTPLSTPSPVRVASLYLRAAALPQFEAAVLAYARRISPALVRVMVEAVRDLADDRSRRPAPPPPPKTRGKKLPVPAPTPEVEWVKPAASEVVAEFRRRVMGGYYSLWDYVTSDAGFDSWVEKWVEDLLGRAIMLGPAPFFNHHPVVGGSAGGVTVDGELLGDLAEDDWGEYPTQLDDKNIDRAVELSGGQVTGHTYSWRHRVIRDAGQAKTFVAYPFAAKWPLPSEEKLLELVAEELLLKAAVSGLG